MRRAPLLVLFLLALLAGAGPGPATAAPADYLESARQSPDLVFSQGVEAYRASDWAGAAERFQALAGLYESAAVHYNLGNARYQQGALGRAVASWSRALALDPWAPDIAHNLQVVTGTPPWGEGLPGTLRRLYLGLSLEALERLVLALAGLALLAFAAARLGGLRPGRPLAYVFLALALLGAAWSYGRVAGWGIGQRAVVVGAGQVEATAGPGAQGEFPRVFTVHPGQLVQVHRRSGPFRQVSLPTGAAGWVPQASLEEL